MNQKFCCMSHSMKSAQGWYGARLVRDRFGNVLWTIRKLLASELLGPASLVGPTRREG